MSKISRVVIRIEIFKQIEILLYYVIKTNAGGQRPIDAITSFNTGKKVEVNRLFCHEKNVYVDEWKYYSGKAIPTLGEKVNLETAVEPSPSRNILIFNTRKRKRGQRIYFIGSSYLQRSVVIQFA